MLQKFVLNLLIEALKSPEVREFAADVAVKLADQLKDDLLPDLVEKVVAVLPLLGAGLIKDVFDRAPNLPDIADIDNAARDVARKILDSDPDLPVLSDIVDISEILRRWL